MFKVPDWEDAPNINLTFTKALPKQTKKNKKKSDKIKETEKVKQVIQVKAKFKAKPKTNSKLKTIHKSSIKETIVNLRQTPTKTEKNRKVNKTRKQESKKFEEQEIEGTPFVVNKKSSEDAEGINIKNYDTDKLDELILDVRKQKLDTYKSDDIEELLFEESPKDSKKNKSKIKSNKPNKIIKTNASMTKVIAKPNQELSLTKNVTKTKLNDKITESNRNTESISSKIIKKRVNAKDLRKKELLKSILQKQEITRNHINVSGNKLRDRMLDRLKAAKFRYLNEKLYTSSGSDAQKLFESDPAAFRTYHEGYQQQVQKWPVKPLDLIVKRIQKMPKTYKIADMGCGEAELTKRVVQAVRSFDLVGTAPGVEACDMAHTPLLAGSMDVAVYCLALMGTDLTQYLIEANRVLRQGGHLLIAEVESRFDNVQTFISDVQRLGFSLKKMDDTHEVFFFMEFTKLRDPPVKKGKLPQLTLKPCIYKKR